MAFFSKNTKLYTCNKKTQNLFLQFLNFAVRRKRLSPNKILLFRITVQKWFCRMLFHTIYHFVIAIIYFIPLHFLKCWQLFTTSKCNRISYCYYFVIFILKIMFLVYLHFYWLNSMKTIMILGKKKYLLQTHIFHLEMSFFAKWEKFISWM